MPALSGLSWVRSGLLLLEVHVLAFAEKHERDQGFLVAEAVAEVAEQKATERAGQKTHGERDEREQRGEHRVGLGDVSEEDESAIACRGAWPPTVR